MSWATSYINDLKDGAETVTFRPKGNSMVPLIHSGDKVTVQTLLVDANSKEASEVDWSKLLKKGDIVLCKVNGQHYLHKVLAITSHSVMIGNNRGNVNGWTSKIYGKVIRIEG